MKFEHASSSNDFQLETQDDVYLLAIKREFACASIGRALFFHAFRIKKSLLR